jgi:hypothetical protein
MSNARHNPRAGCRARFSRRAISLLAATVVLLFNAQFARAGGILTTTSASTLKSYVEEGGTTIIELPNSPVLTLNSPLSPGPNTVILSTSSTVTLTGVGVVRLLTVPSGVSCLVSNIIFDDGANKGSNGVAGVNGGAEQPGGTGGAGNPGYGGAITNGGSLTLVNCLVMDSTVTGGNGGAGGNGGSDAFGENGGNGGGGGEGYGAGIWNQGTLVLTNCTIENNAAVSGAGGPGGTNSGSYASPGNGGSGGVSQGAGLYNANGAQAIIVNCTFNNNSVTGGASQAAGAPQSGNGKTGPAGGAGEGGGVYNAGTVKIVNATLFENTATGGMGGNGSAGPTGFGGNGGAGGTGYGGNVCNSSSLALTNCTIVAGSTFGGAGGGGGAGEFGPGGTGLGGASDGDNIANLSGTLSLMNTILDSPQTGVNAFGSVADNGHNISSDGTPSLNGTGSMLGTDANLDSVLDTNNTIIVPIPPLTLALLYPSPAMGVGGPAVYPFDEQGLPRPAGLVDIGAYQYTGAATYSIAGFVFVGTNTTPGISVAANGVVYQGFTTTTATNGGYTFPSLPADTYTVAPQPAGLFTPAAAVLTVESNNPTAGTNFEAVSNVVSTNFITYFATNVTASHTTITTNHATNYATGVELIEGEGNLYSLGENTTNHSFLLSYQLLAGRSYRIQSATNVLTNNTPWVTIATTNTTAYEAAFFVTLTNSNMPPKLFFRTATP